MARAGRSFRRSSTVRPQVVSAAVAGESVTAPADLGIVDWDQPARFRQLNDRFGPWGLALLEAIVIRSDHAVSAGDDVALDAQP